MELPNDTPASAPPAPATARRLAAAGARRVVFGFGLRELGLGVLGTAVLVATGWWGHRALTTSNAETAEIRAQLAMRKDIAEVYRQQFDALRAKALEAKSWALAQNTEPLRTWARERARRLDALVAQVDHEQQAREFAAAQDDVGRLIERGDLAGAKAKLAEARVQPPSFPPPNEFSRMRHDAYEAPLAEFSRQNPNFYRALRQVEPEVAKEDETVLRAEITAAGAQSVTPQLMLKVELLAAVAANDDPVVTEWSALTSALDYFENPDAATLGRWHRAQQAFRADDWPAASAEMQAIVNSKVRTRQPFRAAFGRVLLKSRPDQPAAAYPFLAEAAAAGDKPARAWVAQEDLRERRYAQAQASLEAAAVEGEAYAVPPLLALYENHAGEIAPDPQRQVGVLERVTDAPDAPAGAWVALGRLYERTDPPGSTKAFACYTRAAAKGSAAANVEIARCALRGSGVPANVDQACETACKAFAAGEREAAAPILTAVLRRAPDRAANAVLQLFEQEALAASRGYTETRIVDGPGVTELKAELARYLDQLGMYGKAARFYAGSRDPAATRRLAQLTTAHPCETCGGTGKVQESVPCPTCGGKGKQICSFCGGTGSIYVPGTPPCATCGGAGTIVQNRKVVTCATCGGTGKGRGSVIKQDCEHCEHGYIRCPDCQDGMIKVSKECPDCHGHGAWTMAERAD